MDPVSPILLMFTSTPYGMQMRGNKAQRGIKTSRALCISVTDIILTAEVLKFTRVDTLHRRERKKTEKTGRDGALSRERGGS